MKNNLMLRILEKPEDMPSVEELQRIVWPGRETDVVPAHMLLAAVHNGGLIIGAFDSAMRLIGFVFGFPGLYFTPDGPRPKHCSHMLAVHPDYRDQGIGFSLKRAQWQMVRHQGIDRITWTYDPLLSRNAYLNIARLGTVCNTYLREEYGEMHDALNVGLPSDRFQVDWWVNSQRVIHRLSRKRRCQLDLAHFLAADAVIINPTQLDEDELPHPSNNLDYSAQRGKFLLVEIPSDFSNLKNVKPALGLAWRMHTRQIFEDLFGRGYLVTDFVHLKGRLARSFYVLSHEESTL